MQVAIASDDLIEEKKTYGEFTQGSDIREHSSKVTASRIETSQGHVGTRDREEGHKEDGHCVSLVGDLNVMLFKETVQDVVIQERNGHIEDTVLPNVGIDGSMDLGNHGQMITGLIAHGKLSRFLHDE